MGVEKNPLGTVRNQNLALEYAPVVARNLDGVREIPLVDVYVNDVCNLKCGFCPVKFGKNNLPVESPERIKLFHPRVITLTGGGEPSIYRYGDARIGDFIAAVRSKMGAIPLGMMTNGVSGMPLSAVNELEWLRVSFNAATPESYVLVHGRPRFRQVIENIRMYLRSAVEKVGVGFVYTPDNFDELVAFVRLMLSEIAPEVSESEFVRMSLQFRPVAYRDYSRFVIDDVTRGKLVDMMGSLLDKERKFLEEQSNLGQVLENTCFSVRRKFGKCFVSLLQANLDARGDVYPCPQKAHFLEESYGNIFNPDFFDLFPSAALKSCDSHSSSTCPNCAQAAINELFDGVDFKTVDSNAKVSPVFF